MTGIGSKYIQARHMVLSTTSCIIYLYYIILYISYILYTYHILYIYIYYIIYCVYIYIEYVPSNPWVNFHILHDSWPFLGSAPSFFNQDLERITIRTTRDTTHLEGHIAGQQSHATLRHTRIVHGLGDNWRRSDAVTQL
jgi:hypothetical protein